MPLPEPRDNETESDFISRCIPDVIETEDLNAESEHDRAQATAICYSQWRRRKGDDMEHEYKTFDFKVTNLDIEGRTVEGYAAVFGNLDLGRDIIHPGAFAKTLAERGNKVRFLWQHDMREPIGKPIEMHEDNSGLFMKAIVSDTARGRDALALLRDGAISGLSIGYDAIPGGTDYTKAEDGEPVRNLRELRLWEVSLVSIPMNEAAGVTALKEVKAVMKTEADGEHPASHYLVVEDPEKPTTWHLRVRNVAGEIDHRLMGAAWAALHGGYRGNVYEGPDKAEAIRKLRALYEREGMDTPKELDASRERKQQLVETLRAALAEAEALVGSSAPADEAGRVENADDQGAGPEPPPTLPDTERLRLDLLAQIESLEA